MNVVVFSPHFPENYTKFSVELSKKGAFVLGIADAPYDDLPADLRKALTEYYKVNDMEDYDEVMRAVAFFTHKYGKIDHLDSLNEYWLFTEARLRTDFNIPGIKNDVIDDMKYKSKMKQRFVNAGITVARGQVIADLETAKKFVEEVGFPIIAKPDSGVGAMGTFKIKDETQLVDFFGNLPDVPYIFEEYVEGNIHSFDGLTDHEGNVVFYTGHIYSEGVMEVVNLDKNAYYYSIREIPADLEEAGRKIIREFNLKGRFFHLEFFRQNDGNLIALEVNMRPPGGYTTDMFNYGSDINVYEWWADIVVDGRMDASDKPARDYEKKFHVAYIGRKWRFDYAHDMEEIIAYCGTKLIFHDQMSGVFSPALGNYGFIVRDPDLEEVKKCIQYIHKIKE